MKGDDVNRQSHRREEIASSTSFRKRPRRNAVQAFAIAVRTLAVFIGICTTAAAQLNERILDPPRGAMPRVRPSTSQPHAELTPETVTRADVARFSRIISLMTAEQLQVRRQILPKVDSIPPQLEHSLNASERDSALLLLAWLRIWTARHATPNFVPASSQAQLLTAHGEQTGLAIAPERSMPVRAKLSQAVVDRIRKLETDISSGADEGSERLNAAHTAYASATQSFKTHDIEQSWRHLHAAMQDLDRLAEAGSETKLACNAYDTMIKALAPFSLDSEQVTSPSSQIGDRCKKSMEAGSDQIAGSPFRQLHLALMRLAQQLDGSPTDPAVTCVDLSYVGDFWNWLWKQVRGGAGGDTNPPGWFPVDAFGLYQSAMGTVESVTMEPDGDIHINLGQDPSVTALINGSDPSGQLVLEIPLCDRWWFSNLDQVGVGATISVVGKWMEDVWNQWYELHPIYALTILTPAPPPGCPPASAVTCQSQPYPWCGQSAPTVLSCPCPNGQVCASRCNGDLCSVDWYCQNPPPVCQTVNGSCTGANGSDQCVTAGGVTQCCHSNWLYGWQPWINVCNGSATSQGCSGPCY